MPQHIPYDRPMLCEGHSFPPNVLVPDCSCYSTCEHSLLHQPTLCSVAPHNTILYEHGLSSDVHFCNGRTERFSPQHPTHEENLLVLRSHTTPTDVTGRNHMASCPCATDSSSSSRPPHNYLSPNSFFTQCVTPQSYHGHPQPCCSITSQNQSGPSTNYFLPHGTSPHSMNQSECLWTHDNSLPWGSQNHYVSSSPCSSYYPCLLAPRCSACPVQCGSKSPQQCCSSYMELPNPPNGCCTHFSHLNPPDYGFTRPYYPTCHTMSSPENPQPHQITSLDHNPLPSTPKHSSQYSRSSYPSQGDGQNYERVKTETYAATQTNPYCSHRFPHCYNKENLPNHHPLTNNLSDLPQKCPEKIHHLDSTKHLLDLSHHNLPSSLNTPKGSTTSHAEIQTTKDPMKTWNHPVVLKKVSITPSLAEPQTISPRRDSSPCALPETERNIYDAHPPSHHQHTMHKPPSYSALGNVQVQHPTFPYPLTPNSPEHISAGQIQHQDTYKKETTHQAIRLTRFPLAPTLKATDHDTASSQRMSRKMSSGSPSPVLRRNHFKTSPTVHSRTPLSQISGAATRSYSLRRTTKVLDHKPDKPWEETLRCTTPYESNYEKRHRSTTRYGEHTGVTIKVLSHPTTPPSEISTTPSQPLTFLKKPFEFLRHEIEDDGSYHEESPMSQHSTSLPENISVLTTGSTEVSCSSSSTSQNKKNTIQRPHLLATSHQKGRNNDSLQASTTYEDKSSVGGPTKDMASPKIHSICEGPRENNIEQHSAVESHSGRNRARTAMQPLTSSGSRSPQLDPYIDSLTEPFQQKTLQGEKRNSPQQKMLNQPKENEKQTERLWEGYWEKLQGMVRSKQSLPTLRPLSRPVKDTFRMQGLPKSLTAGNYEIIPIGPLDPQEAKATAMTTQCSLPLPYIVRL